jgi:hypothetical protein
MKLLDIDHKLILAFEKRPTYIFSKALDSWTQNWQAIPVDRTRPGKSSIDQIDMPILKTVGKILFSSS